MRIAAMTFRLQTPWTQSLKEKRMIVKGIIAQLQNRFHVSAAEIDEQDTHQIIDDRGSVVTVLWNYYNI